MFKGTAGRKCILSISAAEGSLLGCSVLSSQHRGPFRIRAPNQGDALTLTALSTLRAGEAAANCVLGDC